MVPVALIEKSPLANVYGKSDCSWKVMFVFRTGDTELGFIAVRDFVPSFNVMAKEFVTV